MPKKRHNAEEIIPPLQPTQAVSSRHQANLKSLVTIWIWLLNIGFRA